MKQTKNTTFLISIFIVFFIIFLTVFNQIKPFQTTKINLSYKSDITKLINNITNKNLSLKEAEFYKVIEEENKQ